MVSVAGGKLTTHRRIAADVLGFLPPEVRPRRIALGDEPLPGAGRVQPGLFEAELDPVTAEHLRSLYGSDAERLLAYADEPDAFERIHQGMSSVYDRSLQVVLRHRSLCRADGLDG